LLKDRLEGRDLKAIVCAAAEVLERQKATVDALNVFPVPDGDTGTNMSLTLASACSESQKGMDGPLGEVAGRVALGSLMGARGNSGVILSQIFRGMARSLNGKTSASPLETARAMEEGVRTAYKAVMKPVEGTILTVAKEAARAAMEAARDGQDLVRVWRAALEGAEVALENTPSLLPVLRQAGVVDAGGKGLVFFLSAGLESLLGESRSWVEPVPERADFHAVDAEAALTYPYDVQLLVHGEHLPVDRMRAALEGMGDSLLVVGGGEISRVHIHTANPGRVLDACLEFGEISCVEMENMRLQYQAAKAGCPAIMPEPEPEDNKELGVVAVAVGEGIIEVFRSLGADRVIDGGQTMNPSTEQLARAVEGCSAQSVILLPNNPNVILGAEQARVLTGKEVHVLPTRSLPQGMAALLALRCDREVKTNLMHMERAFRSVKTGEVTYAVRDMSSEHFSVKSGDAIGISEGRILSVGETPGDVLAELVEALVSPEDEVISVFYGEMVDPGVATGIATRLADAFPGREVEMKYGGQPLHYYIVSVE
jgi:DAK2 domain fusion protein YloV